MMNDEADLRVHGWNLLVTSLPDVFLSLPPLDEPADVWDEPEWCWSSNGLWATRGHNGRLGGTPFWSDPQYPALEVSERGRVEDNEGCSVPPTFRLPSLDQPPEHTKSFIHVLIFFSCSTFQPLLLCYWRVSAQPAPLCIDWVIKSVELKRLAALSVLFAGYSPPSFSSIYFFEFKKKKKLHISKESCWTNYTSV